MNDRLSSISRRQPKTASDCGRWRLIQATGFMLMSSGTHLLLKLSVAGGAVVFGNTLHADTIEKSTRQYLFSLTECHASAFELILYDESDSILGQDIYKSVCADESDPHNKGHHYMISCPTRRFSGKCDAERFAYSEVLNNNYSLNGVDGRWRYQTTWPR